MDQHKAEALQTTPDSMFRALPARQGTSHALCCLCGLVHPERPPVGLKPRLFMQMLLLHIQPSSGCSSS